MRRHFRNDTIALLMVLCFLGSGSSYGSERVTAPDKRWQLFTAEEFTRMWDRGQEQRQRKQALEQKLRETLPHLRNPSPGDLTDEEIVVLEPLLVQGEDFSRVLRWRPPMLRRITGTREGGPDVHQLAELDRRAGSKFFNWRPGPSDAPTLGTVNPVGLYRAVRSNGILSIFAPPEE